jgi:hypothetical protein
VTASSSALDGLVEMVKSEKRRQQQEMDEKGIAYRRSFNVSTHLVNVGQRWDADHPYKNSSLAPTSSASARACTSLLVVFVQSPTLLIGPRDRASGFCGQYIIPEPNKICKQQS